MKKIIFLFGLFFCLTAHSQFWIDVSARGGWGPTLLINKNVFQDDSLTHQFSSGHTFGGRLGLNFGDEHSINFDISTVTFNQDFEVATANAKQVSFSSLDFAFLYKRILEGRYMEIGPVFSQINDANNAGFNEQNWGAILGFGRSIVGSDRFAVNIGVRLRYIFTDIMTANDQETHYLRAYTPYETSTPLSANIVLDVEWAVGVFRTTTCYGKRRFVSF